MNEIQGQELIDTELEGARMGASAWVLIEYTDEFIDASIFGFDDLFDHAMTVNTELAFAGADSYFYILEDVKESSYNRISIFSFERVGHG